MHEGDSLVRQLDARIELLNRRVVPGLHFAEEDLGQCRPVEHEIAGLASPDVHDRNDAAHHHGKLRQASFIQILAGQGRLRRAKGHGLGLDLLDAAAGANRSVVEPGSGLFSVGVGPFRVDGIGEACAGASDVGCVYRCAPSAHAAVRTAAPARPEILFRIR